MEALKALGMTSGQHAGILLFSPSRDMLSLRPILRAVQATANNFATQFGNLGVVFLMKI